MKRKEDREKLREGKFLEIKDKDQALSALKEIHAYLGVKWGGKMPLNEKHFDIKEDKYPICLFIEDDCLYWAEKKDVTEEQLEDSFRYEREE